MTRSDTRGLRCLAVLTVVLVCLAVQAVFTLPAYGQEVVGWGSQVVGGDLSGDFIAIAAGLLHSLGLKQDGSIMAWGSNGYGQCNIPSPNSGFIAVSAGDYHSLGLKQDGSIVAWGNNGDGQCDISSPNSGFIAISAGVGHSLGLKQDGSIVAWGYNFYGQCDIPSPNNSFIAISAGHYHSLGLKQDGSIVGWGWNGYGQCNVPSPNSGFIAIAAGWLHSLGLKQDGSIVAWGDSWYGQCFIPSPNSSFIAIAAGDWHSLGLKQDGSIVAWGYNDQGQCNIPSPNSGFIAIDAGYWHSLGLKQDGSIVAWGGNDYGQCSIPSPNSGFIAIAAGYLHSLGLKQDGSIVAWGRHYDGACNIPSPNSGFIAIAAGEYLSAGIKQDGSIVAWGYYPFGQYKIPSPNSGFIAIAVGPYHSLGLKQDGSIVAWGWNSYGQCNIPSPNSGFIAIAVGEYHSLGLKQDGSIMAWGSKNYNRCNIPSPNSGFIGIASSPYHSLGLKQDGSIVAWGDNDYGQCNIPSPNSGFVAIAAGYRHSLGLKQDGSVVAWGRNSGGQDIPSPNTGFIAVAAGGWHSVGLKKTVSEPEWSFVQMSDTHLGYSEDKNGKPQNVSMERLAAAIHNILNPKDPILKAKPLPKFIVVTGDIADYGCPDPATTSPSVYKDFVLAVHSALKKNIDVITVPGNHDWKGCPDSGPWGYVNGGLAGVSGLTPAVDLVDWEEGDLHFIGFDTGWGDLRGRGFTDPQWAAFMSIATQSTKPKILFMHHPAVDVPTDQTFKDHLSDFRNYCDPVNNNNVKLLLAGHTHQAHILDAYGSELSVGSTTYPQFIQTPSTCKQSLGDDIPGYRVVNVSGTQVSPQEYVKITDYVKNYKKGENYSPTNLHVYDSSGNHVGLLADGQVERNIGHSYYFYHHTLATDDGNQVLPEEIMIFDPCEEYLWEVVGDEVGTYRLVLTSNEDGNETVFEANGIPTLPGAVHQYLIDWDGLSEGANGVTVFIDREGDGDFEKTVLSDSVLTSDEFDTPSVVEVTVPEAGDAVQDGITLTADATDIDGVDAVSFYIREPNDGNGVPIGQEDLAATLNPVTGKWEYAFDTTQLPDGYYVVLARAVDTYGNVGWSQIVPCSIRNWAVIELLPATPSNKAGRTMPVKFSIRIAQSVDPAMPFVYNEDLEIRIYKSTSPSVILQRSSFGPGATDYRIDTLTEKYITNFKTLTTPVTYVVEIWRPKKNFKVGSFTFKTVK